MDFYRNTIYYSQINDDYMSYIYSQFNNFGFCRRDGSELYWQGNPADGTSDDKICFRWKKDTTNKNYFKYGKENGPAYSSTLEFDWNNGSNYEQFITYRNDWFDGSRTIIFIPLKNNNFILQQFNFRENITPSFVTLNQASKIYQDGYEAQNGKTIISFQNLSSYIFPFCYIKHRYWGRGGYLQTPYQSFILQNVENFDLNKFCNKYWSSSTDLTIHSYNNINQNICTLVRVPYENTFFDGLYLCTTYPCDQIEGKVFSFNGRSFLGVYENFVVELPAN